MDADRYGNLQKHLNPNPVQRWLLKRFHRCVLELVKTTGAQRILDVGCGEGFTMRELRQGGIQAAMVGMDLNVAALAWNRSHAMAQSPLGVSDIHHVPVADGSFDLVLCLEVLEHVPDSSLALAELLRVTRDYVLVSVPHEPFFRGANLLRAKHVRALGNDPEHIHNYSGRAFRRLVSRQAALLWHGYSLPWQIAVLRRHG